MQTHEKIAVTLNTTEAVEALYTFDRAHSNMVVEADNFEIFQFGPYKRTYWFDDDLGFYNFTHTQLQFDENWVEPE